MMVTREGGPAPGISMLRGTRLLLLILFAALLIAGTLFWWTGRACPDTAMVSITTDRQEYTMDDTVSVTIQNTGQDPVSIYCPSWCALGNFPTAVERLVDGRWEYSLGFCPSIGSPLENRGTPDGDFIRHTLPPGGSFRPELTNLGSLRHGGNGTYRIVYYLCGGREPEYSNPFTIRP